jgi:hypothetical protein
MLRHTFVLAGALALCLMFAGAARVAWAQPFSSVEPASRAIILAQEPPAEPGVPRGAKCVNWVPTGHGKMRCNSFCYPRYEKC